MERSPVALIGLLVVTVLLVGCTGSGTDGVRVLAVESFNGFGGDVEGGVCSAKVRNTNPHNVTVTYRFAGGEVQERTLRPTTELENDWTLLNGHCSGEDLELIAVQPS